jgi:hypothetical protein
LVALNGDAVNGVIAGPRMIINDCNVINAISGQRAISNSGQVVVEPTCQVAHGFFEEIVVATPPGDPKKEYSKRTK